MKNISIILIEPENAGNTGAVCRAMGNFDFENLILAGPKFEKDSKELVDRAKWAKDVLKNIKIIKKYDNKNLNTLKKLRKEFDYLVATTAKIGNDYNILRSPLSAEQLAEKINELDLKQKNKKEIKIGIVIGREGIGMTNSEVELCDFAVTIPTSKKYGTMNLSHATTIILYEIFKRTAEENIISHIRPASERDKEQIMKMLNEKLDKMDFTTPEKKETQKTLWKKLVGKSFMSKREAFALMGFFRKMK